jgi:hypothetical protein
LCSALLDLVGFTGKKTHSCSPVFLGIRVATARVAARRDSKSRSTYFVPARLRVAGEQRQLSVHRRDEAANLPRALLLFQLSDDRRASSSSWIDPRLRR